MQPCLAGMCSYRELTDGSLDIADVALMNDALAAKAENQARAQKAADEANKR